jgi:hypothetical protein
MFNKKYPKSCTMIDMSFGPKYNVDYKYFIGSGSWSAKYTTNIFYINTTHNILSRQATLGFRDSIYVQ